MDHSLGLDKLNELLDYRIASNMLESWPVNSIRKRGKAEGESIVMEASYEGITFDYKNFQYRA